MIILFNETDGTKVTLDMTAFSTFTLNNYPREGYCALECICRNSGKVLRYDVTPDQVSGLEEAMEEFGRRMNLMREPRVVSCDPGFTTPTRMTAHVSAD